MRAALVTLAAATAVLTAGCGAVGFLGSNEGNAAQGKELFQQATLNGQPGCGSCHILAAAGTKGTSGPDLDAHFEVLRRQSFQESSFRNMIRGQIAYPEAPMPGKLVEGQDAKDVSEFIARCAGAESCDLE